MGFIVYLVAIVWSFVWIMTLIRSSENKEILTELMAAQAQIRLDLEYQTELLEKIQKRQKKKIRFKAAKQLGREEKNSLIS